MPWWTGFSPHTIYGMAIANSLPVSSQIPHGLM